MKTNLNYKKKLLEAEKDRLKIESIILKELPTKVEE
jgi:hypothetical protein